MQGSTIEKAQRCPTEVLVRWTKSFP